MHTTEILFDIDGPLATITLNRPAKLNAWTTVMDGEFHQAIAAAAADASVRVILITGSGRGFCSGADLSMFSADGLPNQFNYLHSLSTPVIAAINGPAVGLGLILALYCDLRFASSDARFGTAFARRGLTAEYGMAWLLPRLIGPPNALDLLLSARVIDAPEALRMGLVNRVMESETFLADVKSYAYALATQVSPRSLGVIKRQVYTAFNQTLPEAAALAEEEMHLSLLSEDFLEGVAHFLQKRPPVFTGR